MTRADEELLTALRRQARELGQHPAPPASAGELAAAEAALGFCLPALLQAVYSQVGNGGFGPGRGLLPIHGAGPEGSPGAVENYRRASLPLPTAGSWRFGDVRTRP